MVDHEINKGEVRFRQWEICVEAIVALLCELVQSMDDKNKTIEAKLYGGGRKKPDSALKD